MITTLIPFLNDFNPSKELQVKHERWRKGPLQVCGLWRVLVRRSCQWDLIMATKVGCE